MDIATRNRRVMGAIVTSLTLVGCGGAAEAVDAPTSQEGAAPTARVINVETSELEPRDFTDVIRVTGRVEADREVVVSAEESGVIREVLVDKGAYVREGQELFRIDDGLLRSQVDEARARSTLAEETWQRRRRLWEQDRVGSELAYLEAKYAAEQAAATLTFLEQRLARTTVRAPIGGVLDARMIEVGSMVSPGAATGRIVDLDPAKIEAGVPERYAADIAVGASARVVLGALADQEFQGRISFVGATIDPDSRTFPVELAIPNPGRTIKPEMVADVSLVLAQLEGVLVVPREALVRVEQGFVAFVAVQDQGGWRAEVRPVTTGSAREGEVVVTEGLDAGDHLIVVGQKQVADGDRVRIVEGR